MNLSTFNFQFSILILNGPNLNRLGMRKPEIYGSKTMAQILLEIQRALPEVHLIYKQSNHEGDLIDWIQEANGEYSGITSECSQENDDDHSHHDNDYDKLHDFLEAFEYFHKEADLLSISFHGIPSEYP